MQGNGWRGGINVTGAHAEKAAQRLEEFNLIIKLSVSSFFIRFTDINDNFRVSVCSMSLSVLSFVLSKSILDYQNESSF